MLRSPGAILAISDDQSPFGHPDRFDFVYALYEWIVESYGIPLVVHMGDEVDQHNNSAYANNPNLPGPLQEELLAQKDLDTWESMFPEMHLVSSNHSIRIYKRASEAGITDRWLRTFKEAWNKPGWTWHEDLYIKLTDGNELYINHGEGKTAISKVRSLGCCVMQGHRHAEAYVQYFNNGRRTLWGVQAGSLIDPKNLAYLYAKHHDTKSVLGTAIVLEGIPQFCPMIVDNKGRWIGKLV